MVTEALLDGPVPGLTSAQRRQQALEARRAAQAGYDDDDINEIVDRAPSPTDEQIAKLRVLLAPGNGGGDAAT